MAAAIPFQIVREEQVMADSVLKKIEDVKELVKQVNYPVHVSKDKIEFD